MKRPLFIHHLLPHVLVATACCFGFSALGDDSRDYPPDQGKSASTNLTARQFAHRAYHCGAKEIEAAKLATRISKDPQIQAFAAKLIEDHQKAQQSLVTAAQTAGITLPMHEGVPKDQTDRTVVESATSDRKLGDTPREDRAQNQQGGDLNSKRDDRTSLNKLENLSGTSFDAAFAQLMVEDHEKAVNLFKNASQSVDQADLKALAATTLPTLEDHLRTSQSLNQRLQSERDSNVNR